MMNPEEDAYSSTNSLSEVPIERSSSSSSGACAASLSLADVNLMEKGTSLHNSHTFETSDSFTAVNEQLSPSKRWKLMCWIPLAIVTLLALAVGLGVGLSSSSNQAMPQSPAADSDPPSRPAAPVPRASLEDIVSWLSQQGISQDALQTVGTPQNRAARWLAQEDQVVLPPLHDATTSSYLLTVRYVLVVLYYQLRGEYWPTQVGFLSPNEGVCDWHGISRKTNGQTVDNEIGGLRCDEESGLPVILDLGRYYYMLLCVCVILARFVWENSNFGVKWLTVSSATHYCLLDAFCCHHLRRIQRTRRGHSHRARVD